MQNGLAERSLEQRRDRLRLLITKLEKHVRKEPLPTPRGWFACGYMVVTPKFEDGRRDAPRSAAKLPLLEGPALSRGAPRRAARVRRLTKGAPERFDVLRRLTSVSE